MPRLHMFVEGVTEQVFASTVLVRHLAGFGVWLQKPVLVAHAHKKGITHRGGGRRFAAMQKDIVRRLKEDTGADVYFTTMIDLYALHSDFPGRSAAAKLRRDPYVRVESLEAAWRKETADERSSLIFSCMSSKHTCLRTSRSSPSSSARAPRSQRTRQRPTARTRRSEWTMGKIPRLPNG